MARTRLATPLLFLLVFLILLSLFAPTKSITEFAQHYSVGHWTTSRLEAVWTRCRNFPGASDVLVIVKTGATEVAHKLPVHVKTGLSCYPNSIIVSDHEEVFEGHAIQDALATVDPVYKQDSEEFQLYQRIKTGGRDGLSAADLSGESLVEQKGEVGRAGVQGWRLDKWKFLPMLHQAYTQSPNKKWYAVVETDTFLFWHNLLELTRHLDPQKPFYIGGPTFNAGIAFAHGGSGILISNAAMKKVVAEYSARKREWEDFTNGQNMGDYVLGKAFFDVGINITSASPFMQGRNIGIYPWDLADFNVSETPLWCYPIVTYHRMASKTIQDLWDLEQDWISRKGEKTFLRNKDIFEEYILPRMRIPQPEWDNDSSDIQESVNSVEGCERICEKTTACLQYKFDNVLRQCLTSREPKYGTASKGSHMYSSWMHGRIEAWKDARPQCQETPWMKG